MLKLTEVSLYLDHLPEYLEGLREIFDQEFAAGELPPMPERQ